METFTIDSNLLSRLGASGNIIYSVSHQGNVSALVVLEPTDKLARFIIRLSDNISEQDFIALFAASGATLTLVSDIS